MKCYVDKTLAYYRAAPQMQKVSLAHVDISAIAGRAREFIDGDGNTKPIPDEEAIEFYLLNHLMAVLGKHYTAYEPLPPWASAVGERYLQVLSMQTLRMVFYMAIICTRESRHNKSPEAGEWNVAFGKKWGQRMRVWFDSLRGHNSSTAAELFCKNAPKVAAGPYMRACTEIFDTGKFSGNYGGKPWANIARTLSQFIDGEITAEMLVDTAYTLAHNCGPIFNKGMIYQSYTTGFLKVLDVQRSGQIPEYVREVALHGLPLATRGLLGAMLAELPNEFGTYVDWFKVEKLGSLHHYPVEKKQQVQKHGKPDESVLEPPLPGQKVLGKFKILPSMTVDIVERAA